MTIHLLKGRGVVQVDDADYRALSQYRWRLKKSPHDRIGYAMTSIEGGTVYMHRLLCPGAAHVDHINGDSFNNHRANLRPCTHAENLRNQQPQRGREFKGASFKRARAHLARPWSATIQVDGRSLHLGYHATEVEAAQAYDAAAQRFFGEFARTNFSVEALPVAA